MLIAIAESKLGIGVATYTHLGNANNLFCREAEKSVYKTCMSRISSPKDKTQFVYEKMTEKHLIKAVRWVKVVGSQSHLGLWRELGHMRSRSLLGLRMCLPNG